MKQTIIIIASILFSTLFYSQNLGLNLSLFSIVTLIILAINNFHKFKNRTTIFFSFVYMITALLVFTQNSSLSILANCIAFFTLLGSVNESKSSIYIQWFNGVYTTIAGFFHHRFQTPKTEEQASEKRNVDIWQLAKLILIPLVFVILFVLLYKDGNQVFHGIISQINFDFINVQWVLFSVLGYYLFSNIINPVQVDSATNTDLETGNSLLETKIVSIETLKKEKQLGTTLLLLLNILIAFYLVTDIIALSTLTATAASVLSSQVHTGINTLIGSILIAIVIILYFFRGNLNFFKENKTLKTLSYVWIFLNAILVVSIALKNQDYIASFGLTYKRIGVCIYLLLTLIGLITTFLKVFKIKNLWFLFRVNSQIAFLLLILFSLVNWDYSITKYNLENAPSLDLNYLINLSDNNAVLLNAYRKTGVLSEKDSNKIDYKYNNYIKRVDQRNWQEYTYANFQLNSTTKTANY